MKVHAYDEVLETVLRLDLSLSHPDIRKAVWIAGFDVTNSEVPATENKPVSLEIHLRSGVSLRGLQCGGPRAGFKGQKNGWNVNILKGRIYFLHSNILNK
jgi:hypothetical protein